MTTTQSQERRATVIKVGGARLRRDEYIADLGRYLHKQRAAGQRLVVVHGGGPEIGELHEALGVPFTKVDGQRVTSEESMPLVTMVLCGLVNKRVVARLVSDDLPAVGLSGVDGAWLRSRFLDRDKLGRVGTPPRVDTTLLNGLHDRGLIPVVAPVCLGPDGRPVNVNADSVAHAVATALQAESLDFVSDIPGVRMSADEVASRLSADEIKGLLGTPIITQGMIPKLQAALAAIDAEVGRVRIGDLPGMTHDTATECTA